MTFRCSNYRRQNFYTNEKPDKCFNASKYGCGSIVLLSVLFWLLRDTTPVMFVEPSISDMQLDRGDIVNSNQINDVYWRIAVRHVSSILTEVCQQQKYALLTNKNVLMDGIRMKESYIYLCHAKKPVVNARAVVTNSATKTVRCIESYANRTKTVTRNYPFSLKYVCGETFVSKTKIIREPMQACIWLHAIDIVESLWD